MSATTRHRLALFVLAAFIALLGSLPAAAPAGAAPRSEGWSSWGYLEHGSNVQIWNSGAFVGWCASDRARSARLHGDTVGPSAFAVRSVVAGEAFVPGSTHDPGSPAVHGQDSISAEDTAVVAAILHRWTPAALHGGEIGGIPVGSREIAAAVHYALASLQVAGFEEGQPELPESIKELAHAVVEEGRQLAGPASLEEPVLTLPRPAPRGEAPESGSADRLGAVTSASGSPLVGLEWTATISGPAVWTTTGAAEASGRTVSGGESRSFRVTGEGEIRVSLTVSGLPATSFLVHEHPVYQDLFSAGPETEAE
ncbi:MAG: hypothetical protein Q4G64_02625, partial [bacterium]|nr:hypothetical protein [bacterium]